MTIHRFFAAALVALAAAAPLGALAQGVPSYAQASPPYADGEENIHGRIVSFDGAYGLRVSDNRGYTDNGPTMSLGLFFGTPGWWHGSELHAGYHYVGGARVYPNTHVHPIYTSHGGTFHGRDVAAPVAHGGYYPPGGVVGRRGGPGPVGRAVGVRPGGGHGHGHG